MRIDDNIAENARTRLAAIEGVSRVIIDPSSGDVALICTSPSQAEDILAEARAILREVVGANAKPPRIEVTVRAESSQQGRVRFGEVRRQSSTGSVRVDVELEWGESSFSGSATGEPGIALELRTAGQAAVNALTALVSDLDLRLAGVKQVKSFDAELIVVSLYATDDPSRKFVGAVVAGADPLRSAVLAVLSALNRVMGNYLNRP